MAPPTDHPVADLIRVALVFVAGGLIAGQTIAIGVFYYRALALSQRAATAAGRPLGWAGLLPRHVAFIATSYLLLVGAAVYEVASRVHEPLAWRTYVYGPAFVLGIFALRDVLRHERRVSHPSDHSE